MNNARKILHSINSPGWDGLDAEPAPIKLENLDVMRDLDLAFKRTFSSPTGKKVLENLHTVYCDPPCWVPGLAEPYAYAREGQKSVIEDILKRVKRADDIK